MSIRPIDQTFESARTLARSRIDHEFRKSRWVDSKGHFCWREVGFSEKWNSAIDRLSKAGRPSISIELFPLFWLTYRHRYLDKQTRNLLFTVPFCVATLSPLVFR
jgi:hypothetical protein